MRKYAHLGKYEGELHIAPYVDAQASDETLGELETSRMYQLYRGGFEPTPELIAEYDLNSEEVAYLRGLAGAITIENHDGFVKVDYFDSPEKLKSTWGEIELFFGKEVP